MAEKLRLLLCTSLLLAGAAPGAAALTSPHSDTPSLSRSQEAVLARVDSLWETGAGLSAQEPIRRFVAEARSDADSLYLLNLLYREGRVLAALNRSVDAQTVLREGLLMADAMHERLLYRRCLRWLGVALIGQGLLEDARASFEELLRIAIDADDEYHEGYAWMGLAYYDWQTGKAGEAREIYTRSVLIFRRMGHVRGELWALVGLNNALTMLGAYEEAIAGNERIIVMGRENESPEIEAMGNNNLAVLLYSLGDPGEALAHFQRAARLQEQNGNLREAVLAGQNVSLCEVALGRTQKASASLQQFLDISRENGYFDLQVSLLNNLAQAHLRQGSCARAARLFQQALTVTEGLTAKSESDAIIGLSTSLAGMDSTRAALRFLREKADRLLDVEDVMIQCTFRTRLAERLLDAGYAAEAFDTAMAVERRAVEFGLTGHRLEALPVAARAIEALGEPDSAAALLQRAARLWEADRGVPLDREWREQRGAAAKDLFTRLIFLALNHPSDHPRDERVRRAFAYSQTYKARTLLERIIGPAGPGPPALEPSPVTLEELQSRVLLPDELLLEFVVGRDRSLLFACTKWDVRALELPGERELNRKATLFRALAAGRPSARSAALENEAIHSTARSFSRLLVGPCADLLSGCRHVIVAPDGPLNMVPFSLLVQSNRATGKADGTGPRGTMSLDGRPTLSAVPSATVLASLRADARASAPAGDRSHRVLALAGRSTVGGVALSGAREEVRSLARRYANVVTPTGAISMDSLSRFDVLHFAAHSTADDQFPWRSAIHFGGTEDSTVSAILRASDIAASDLPARLAVLSSCESAGGRVLSGEGVQGLTSAFLSAGVPAVLAALWPVDDRTTVDFMRVFYRELEKGQSVAESATQAQLRAAGHSRTAHPFYWAGFVVIGEGNQQVHLAARPQTWPLWALIVVAVSIAWMVWATMRKKHGGVA